MQSAIEMQVKSMARKDKKMHKTDKTHKMKRHMLTVEPEMKDWLELQGSWSLRSLAELRCQLLCLVEAQVILIFLGRPGLDSLVCIPRSTKVSSICGTMKQVLQIQLMVPVCWAPRPAS
mmetsp:Transcript_58314/g.127541  ORF Transcript_58314/g.127541 Transcript_58314/m.127541 type:complete len:119 (+) Transcript_58314:1606-1962(+)